MNQRVTDYWTRRGILGRKMVESSLFTERDLLLLMPNNYKKMHGLPMTRANGQRKRVLKKRCRTILNRKIFPITQEVIEETLPQKIENTFSCFTDIADMR